MNYGYIMGGDSFSKNLLLGEKILDKLGYRYADDDKGVPPEVEAALYHEMAHIKNHDSVGKVFSFLSPCAGLTAGLLAMRMIEKYQTKKRLQKAVSEEAGDIDLSEQEKKTLEEFHRTTNTKTLGDKILRAAKYVAAGILGLGVGIAIKVMINHRMEYRADKFAAEKMGSPEALIGTLTKLQNLHEEILEESSPDMKDTARSVNRAIGYLSHPPIEKRIERLSAMR